MRDLAIAYGSNRQTKTWVNKTVRYEDLKERLKVTIRTPESAEEYIRMNKAQKDAAKDHGGFVGGVLKGGRRKIETVVSRSMIALDGDRITKEFLDDFETITPYTSCLYTTHSSTEEEPRVRMVFPLTRDVTPEEFVAVARYLAQMLGIDFFDECSYQPNQLMYWPSSPQNGLFVFKEAEKEWLDPDTILSAHPEWTDPTRLPTSSRESRANQVTQQKVQDPLSKEGTVGLFNRVYFPVTRALEQFLSDVYEPTENEDRWHLITSVSVAGVEIKDDRFVYSHHATDPAYLKLCNAFDIVRTHKFGDMDERASFRAMCDFAMQQDEVKILAAIERRAQAEKEFAGDPDWQRGFEYEPRSTVLKNCLHNLLLILQNDPNLKGIRYNEFSDGMEIENAPWKRPEGFKYWREADDAQLVAYVDSNYGNFSARNYNLAVMKVCDDRSYHPVKDFFATLPEWDGKVRVETVLIDCFGAADNAYVRAVTRKTFVGAVARVMRPGCQFDTMLVMNGFQGQKKSSLIRRLCGEWFNDDISFAQTKDKTAAEKLQGYWIIEFSEMTGLKKADIEGLKAFISRRNDIYRAAYGKRPAPHPRQCIFIGTTNADNGFLRDTTGNRRYWPVKTVKKFEDDPAQISEEYVRQFWAEALWHFNNGEKLYIEDDSILKYAVLEQREAMEADEREGIVMDYLDTLLPENWGSMSLYERRNFLNGDEFGGGPGAGTQVRKRVCTMEIWCECFGRDRSQLSKRDSGEIAAIMAHIPGWKKMENKQRFGIYGVVGGYERSGS